MASPVAVRARRCPLTVERLERRDLLTGFQPTAVEQLFLEQLNDARANPAAYGQSIGLDLSNVAPAQPLAFNPQLVQAARLHAQDMAARGYFDHYTPEGLDPGARLNAAGFAWNSYGESIAGGSAFPGPAEALRGLIIDQGVPDLGHRVHLLAIDAVFKDQTQVGIGVDQNTAGPLQNYYVIDTGVGSDRRPFLTGVVFRDANGNGRYDVGEGLAGVTLAVAGVGNFTTYDSGGYSIELNPGTYSVTVSGGAFGPAATQTVALGAQNVRVNFTASDADPAVDAFVRKLYVSALGRTAGDNEVAFWRPQVQAYGQGAVANAIERSHEAHTRVVKGWYATYLGRPASNGEEQSWVAALDRGVTQEQVLDAIVGSPEYLNRAGQLFAGDTGEVRFVQGVFQQFLNRTAGAAEVANFVQVIATAGRAAVAQIVQGAPEYRAAVVRSFYADLLHRSTDPTPGEVAGWVNSGFDLATIRCAFESSQEYYVNG
jgi:uncharacterized protein YkwD